MSALDTQANAAKLRAFLRRSCERGDAGLDAVEPDGRVTALIYFFWPQDVAPQVWPEFAGAILETWRNCGRLKTVIVVDRMHACVESFAGRFPNVVIQEESGLVPGDITTMSRDCNARLWKRFDTEYVLVIQNDGFPLRPGLKEFVDMRYDFIGSPHCRPLFIPDLLTRILRYCPTCGGFSMRSRRICWLGARLWAERGYENRPWVDTEMAEDYFFTRTLPRSGLRYWLARNQAPSKVSDRFSFGGLFDFVQKDMPFGFHTANGFAEVARRFGVML